MTHSILRIDPDLPVCWEDPQTLRIGFDQPVARVANPSSSTQRLLTALVSGVPSSRLPEVLSRAGATSAEWHALAETLSEALELGNTLQLRGDRPQQGPWPPSSERTSISVIGPGSAEHSPSTALLIDTLRRTGVDAQPFTPHRAEPHLVLIVERYLEPFSGARRDAAGLPQLSIRFTDRSVSVGPLVPGEGRPCLECVTMHDIDAEPALAMLSAQLLGTVPASETPASVEAAAALALTLVRHWRAGSQMPMRTRLRLPVRHGLPEPVPISESASGHPDCGCAALESCAGLARGTVQEARTLTAA